MATEEPHTTLMSSPFSVASSSTGPPAAISPSFSMASSFTSFPYGYVSSLPAPPLSGPPFGQQQSPTHFYTAQPLPPGENDLEILERLKETIKKGQHEFFRPVPRPAALASIYLGPHTVSHILPDPEQIPHEQYHNEKHERSHSTGASAVNNCDSRSAPADKSNMSTSHVFVFGYFANHHSLTIHRKPILRRSSLLKQLIP